MAGGDFRATGRDELGDGAESVVAAEDLEAAGVIEASRPAEAGEWSGVVLDDAAGMADLVDEPDGAVVRLPAGDLSRDKHVTTAADGRFRIAVLGGGGREKDEVPEVRPVTPDAPRTIAAAGEVDADDDHDARVEL